MYSYEERIRAVKLYIKLGKRTGPTNGSKEPLCISRPHRFSSGIRVQHPGLGRMGPEFCSLWVK